LSGTLLLINANSCHLPYAVYPLGMSHVAAACRNAGFTVEMFDMNAQDEGLEAAVRRVSPDFIGVSMRNIDDTHMQDTLYFVPAYAALVKRIHSVSDVPIILGGSAFSLFPSRLLDITGADYGVFGEAEMALPMLLKRLKTDTSVQDIPGLVYRNGTDIQINDRVLEETCTTPTPLRPEKFASYYIKQSSMLNIQTQRGCPFTCCYCTYPIIEGTSIRFRSASSIVDDFEAAAAVGAKYLFIVDSVFNTSDAHVSGVCEEILSRKLKISWGCFLRPQGVTRELMNLMARAGLTHIEFGTDSLCDSVLAAYGKGFTVDDVVSASAHALAERVRYAHFLILGGPGETHKTIEEGLANSIRIKRTVFFPFIGMRVYPGTPLFDVAIQEGLLSASSDMLAPFFYVSPHIDKEKVYTRLKEYAIEYPNWIINELPPEKLQLMNNFRKQGVAGPLWEFLAR
jgi:radical SAM superfamily enzyme YgiQ (UPF0313 family)